MIAMTWVAVACFVLFVLPPSWSSVVLGFCFVLASAAVLSLLVYGQGNIRAFAIGCVIPLVMYWIQFNAFTRLDPAMFFIIAFVTVASGFVSVGVRRYCVSKQGVDHSATDA